MGRTQVEVFWTSSDLIAVLDQVGKQIPLSFAELSLSETEKVSTLADSAALSAYIAASTDPTLSFLAFESGSPVGAEPVPQKKGGILYAVDQRRNPRSVVFHLGRLYPELRTLLAGQVGTGSDDPAALSLYSIFKKVVRKQFTKVQSYWVGPEALRLLDSGGKLSVALKSPPEYDLRR